MASRSLYAEWFHPMGARPFGPKLADPMPVRVALPLAGASMPAKMELPHTSGVTPLSPQQAPETLPPLQWVANGLSKYNWDDANMDEAILKTLIQQACMAPTLQGWAQVLHFATRQVTTCLPLDCPRPLRDAVGEGTPYQAFLLYWQLRQVGAQGPEWHRFARAIRDLCCLCLVVFEACTHMDKKAFDVALVANLIRPSMGTQFSDKDMSSQFHQTFRRLFRNALQAFPSNAEEFNRKRKHPRVRRILRLEQHMPQADHAEEQLFRLEKRTDTAGEVVDDDVEEQLCRLEESTDTAGEVIDDDSPQEVCYVDKPSWVSHSAASLWLNALVPQRADDSRSVKLQQWQATINDLLMDMSKWVVQRPGAHVRIRELIAQGNSFAIAIRECERCLEPAIPFQ